MEIGIKKASKSISERRRTLRNNLWPEVEDAHLWLRTQRVGFTTIPRGMALIGRILDQLSGKGFPLASTYLALWCWVFDEAFVEVRSPRELAFESGFSGTRGEATWRSRMKKLEDLGFIKVKAGLAGDFQYILILNPFLVIEQHYANIPMDSAYIALLSRLAHVGADDLDHVITGAQRKSPDGF